MLWFGLFFFFYKSRAKEDGVLVGDCGLPAPVSFRLVKLGPSGKGRTVRSQKELVGEEADQWAILMLHASCISYVQLCDRSKVHPCSGVTFVSLSAVHCYRLWTTL